MTCLPTITSITNFKWQVFCFKFCMLQAYEMLVSDLIVVFETIHVTPFITMTPLLKSMSMMVESPSLISPCNIQSIMLSFNNSIMVHSNGPTTQPGLYNLHPLL